MPLEKGSDKAVIDRNIAELIRAGHPPDQAAAIAHRMARGDGLTAHILAAAPALLHRDGVEDQPRDENGRWTGGGDVSKAGTHEVTGRPLPPRAFKLITPSGKEHVFSDRPGDKDTYSFASGSPELQDAQEAEAYERMHYAIHDMANPAPGHIYEGIVSKRSKESGAKELYHEMVAPSGKSRLELVGTYRRIR